MRGRHGLRGTPKAAQSRYGGKEDDTVRWRCFLSFHAPVWAQAGHHVVLGADHVTGQPADTIVAHADVVRMCVGNACSVAANTACVTAGVAILKPGWRGKVQTSERARFPQGMTGNTSS